MFADDLILIAKTEEELQRKITTLSDFCKEKKLEINGKKPKCMVFNHGNKLCKASLFINNTNIENVKSYKYLGFTIGAKNCSLINTMADLSIKAKRAIFALNNKIKISLLPLQLAIQIFTTQIVPILLYGAELWGPYLNFDFTKWEKSEMEKTQTQFLKRVLRCNIQTQNLTSRAEVGCRPLLIDIIINLSYT